MDYRWLDIHIPYLILLYKNIEDLVGKNSIFYSYLFISFLEIFDFYKNKGKFIYIDI
ncbi:hypothetical protein CGSHiII_05264 [Haemophilus influenzae PittII]|nr:hypothetical protein CGSHiII_05264 [Haemophilus influenzae PittII]